MQINLNQRRSLKIQNKGRAENRAHENKPFKAAKKIENRSTDGINKLILEDIASLPQKC